MTFQEHYAKMTENSEAAEEIKPEIMSAYRRLEKYVAINPGYRKSVFSLVAVTMLSVYMKGKAAGRAEGDEQPPESAKAGLARRRQSGGHFG